MPIAARSFKLGPAQAAPATTLILEELMCGMKTGTRKQRVE